MNYIIYNLIIIKNEYKLKMTKIGVKNKERLSFKINSLFI